MNKPLLKPLLIILTISFASFLFGVAERFRGQKENQQELTICLFIALSVAVFVYQLWVKADIWFPYLKDICRENTEFIEKLSESSKHIGLYIALAAGAGMYAELVLIRMQADFFQLFAHFKNISLLSCFLGLGIGYSLKNNRTLSTPLAIPLIAIQIIFANLLLRTFDLNFLLLNPTSEQATMGLYNAKLVTDIMMSYGLLTFMFVFNSLCFIPLGQLASRLMEKQKKLVAYSWNLAGSLVGIAVIIGLSYLWTPPAVWFAFIVIALIPFIKGPRSLIALAVASVATLALLVMPVKQFRVDYHSPYQIISVILEPENPRLFSNNTWFQTMLDLRPQALEKNPDSQPMADYYALAYLFKPAPENVLIVGSGTGNDVASALRHGASYIDAVEIDPAIIEIGKHMHPENPYGDARVHIHNDDARSFIRRADKKYDLIVYGLLDSATLMSGNSAGMRMDSYVWTKEAFAEAKEKLKPDGVISMSACIYPSMGPKIFKMLTETFSGLKPYVYRTNWDAGFTFLIGEGLKKPDEQPPFEDLTEKYTKDPGAAVASTDDWPFLFIFEKTYPFSYMSVILVLFIISYVLLTHFSSVKVKDFSASCFFLGAGFMLVETKSIAQLALVYGSTWIVTSAVIASILVLAALANLLIIYKVNIAKPITYILIIASLAFGLFILDYQLTGFDPATEKLTMTVAMTLPLFFSGLAFSQEVLKCKTISIALASNLLGAMLGGFLEYNAIYFGYKSLFYFAGVLYLLAFLFSLKDTRAKSEQAKEETQEVVA